MLIIIIAFQNWRHYFERSYYSITIFTNYNNLYYFITTTTLNQYQSRWTLVLTKYNFKIKYCSSKINFANKSSRQFDYKKKIHNKLYLLILQNKLKNITIIIIDLISIIIRNIAKTQKMRFESAINISRIKKIDKDNLDKFFNSRNNNLF